MGRIHAVPHALELSGKGLSGGRKAIFEGEAILAVFFKIGAPSKVTTSGEGESRCTKSRSVPSQFMKPRGQWSPFVRVATKAVAKGFAVITDLRAFLSDSAADPCGAGSPEGCHLGVSARPGRDHSAHAWSPSSHPRREVEDPKRAEVLDLNVCSKAAFG